MDNKENNNTSDDKKKESFGKRFMRAFRGAEEEKPEADQQKPDQDNEEGKIVDIHIEIEKEEVPEPSAETEPKMLNTQNIELEITPKNHRMRADGQSKVLVRAQVLCDGKEFPRPTVDFGLLTKNVGDLHKVASNEVEFIAGSLSEDTVAQIEVLYRYGDNSLRKQSKVFLEGGKPHFAVSLEPSDGIIRGNSREEAVLTAQWTAFKGDYTIPCPADFESVSGLNLGELQNVLVDENNKHSKVDRTRKKFKPHLTRVDSQAAFKITPQQLDNNETRNQLKGMFQNPETKPVETIITIRKAELEICLESNRTEVDATGLEDVLVWGYLMDNNIPVPSKIEFKFENLLPDDKFQILDALSDDAFNVETIPVETRIFFQKYPDCLRWAVIRMTSFTGNKEDEIRSIKVIASGMDLQSSPMDLKQLNPRLDLELNKSRIKAGEFVIITPYIIIPSGGRLPVTHKIYNPAGDPEYLKISIDSSTITDPKILNRILENYKVTDNTAQFKAPNDIHGYKVNVHARIPVKNFILSQNAVITILPPEYRIRPLKKSYYEDENEITYEISMNPVNQKEWTTEVIVEDESRNRTCPPLRQFLQFPKGQGIVRGKYKFSRTGKPAEKGGIIKISLADSPDVFTVIRILAPFQIKMTTKLARFRIDHLEDLGEKSVNFQQEFNLWVKPGERKKQEE